MVRKSKIDLESGASIHILTSKISEIFDFKGISNAKCEAFTKRFLRFDSDGYRLSFLVKILAEFDGDFRSLFSHVFSRIFKAFLKHLFAVTFLHS